MSHAAEKTAKKVWEGGPWIKLEKNKKIYVRQKNAWSELKFSL